MSQWMPILSDAGYREITARRNAMPVDATDKEVMGERFDTVTELLATKLLFEIPDVSWTIEVDILGRHRITIYFKGADVSIDS